METLSLKENVRLLKASGTRAQDIAFEYKIPLSRVYRYCKTGWHEQKRKRNNEIRKWHAKGFPQAELAREYRISRQRVNRIVKKGEINKDSV